VSACAARQLEAWLGRDLSDEGADRWFLSEMPEGWDSDSSMGVKTL
jgi:hypothetical protein